MLTYSERLNGSGKSLSKRVVCKGLVWYKVSNFGPGLRSFSESCTDMDYMESESTKLPTYPSLNPKLLYKAVTVNAG